jgi:hypothetical protein
MDFRQYLKREVLEEYSSGFIIITNILLLALALVFRWSIYEVILAFIIQNLIVGFFYLIRILNVSRNMLEYMRFSANFGKKIKYLGLFFALSIFFLVHFGILNWFYMVNIIMYIDVLSWALFIIPAVIFILPHLILYREKLKLQREEYQIKSIIKFMWIPYVRIVPMHAVMLPALLFKESTLIIIIFTLLKTAVDFASNKVERRLNNIYANTSTESFQKPKNKNDEWLTYDGKTFSK